jgi:3-hydroxyacyl-[acyl-carrier-protein] dehydratase
MPFRFETLENLLAEHEVFQSHPYIFIDRIEAQTTNSIHMVKNVTGNEWPTLAGAYFPMWAILETMAQAAGCLDKFLQADTPYQNRILTRIKRARFYRPVIAGDQLHIHVHLVKKIERHAAFSVQALVSKIRVSKAELYFFHF